MQRPRTGAAGPPPVRRGLDRSVIYTKNLDLSRYCFGEQGKSLFVTFTSLGYLDYTLNLIESVKRLGFSQSLVVFALDAEGYKALLAKAGGAGVGVVYYRNRHDFREMQLFEGQQWHRVTSYKIEIVHRLLRRGHDVLFTDGDIVFLRDPRAFLKDRLGQADILVQDDSSNLRSGGAPATTILCTGFFYVRSNDKTVDAFHPRHMRFPRWKAALRRILRPGGEVLFDDQRHFNNFIKHRVNVGVLPRGLFPNGYYYLNEGELSPECYLIHFNFLVGEAKRQRMIRDGYYFLETE